MERPPYILFDLIWDVQVRTELGGSVVSISNYPRVLVTRRPAGMELILSRVGEEPFLRLALERDLERFFHTLQLTTYGLTFACRVLHGGTLRVAEVTLLAARPAQVTS